MITGTVNASKQAVISIHLIGPGDGTLTIDAVIDTGFDGSLTVTPSIANALNLPYFETRSYELGSGERVDFPIHGAQLFWDGAEAEVSALVTDGGVLVGMSLLQGFRLCIDAVDGGGVSIQPFVE